MEQFGRWLQKLFLSAKYKFFSYFQLQNQLNSVWTIFKLLYIFINRFLTADFCFRYCPTIRLAGCLPHFFYQFVLDPLAGRLTNIGANRKWVVSHNIGNKGYPWLTAANLCSRRYVILGWDNIKFGLWAKRAGSGSSRLTGNRFF